MFISKAYSNLLTWWVVSSSLCGVMMTASCGSRTTDNGTETHWLTACDSDAECGGPTSCLCGVCTITCEVDEGCPARAPVCLAASENSCSSLSVGSICSELRVATPDGGPPPNGEAVKIELLPPNLDLALKPIPKVNTCDDADWCWFSRTPGEAFNALSRDGKYAVGQNGVVFDTQGVYLPRPSIESLVTVATHGDSLWVGDSATVWRRTARGWEAETNAGPFKIVVDKDGTLWGPSHTGELLRRDNGVWTGVDLPRSRANEAVFVLDDITTLDDGSVWVLGEYLTGRIGEATLFVWADGQWREYPSNMTTGRVRFLEGAKTPFVYALEAFLDDAISVFAPTQDWKILKSSSAPFIDTLFWGPDGRLWQSGETGLAVFGEEASESGAVACETTAPWDEETVLCAKAFGGLGYLSVAKDGELIDAPESDAPEVYNPELFGTLPTPVWGQTPVAWAANASDVWRAPLEHFDGRTWSTHLKQGDEFFPIRIDGTASDDVWFVAQEDLRHWDGSEVTSVALPPAAEYTYNLSVRAITATDVWLLRHILEGASATVQVLHWNGRAWGTSYNALVDDEFFVAQTGEVIHRAATIAGTAGNLWAAFGQTVLRFDGTTWTQAWQFTSEVDGVGQTHKVGIIDAATDADALWLLTDAGVHLLREGVVERRGYYAGLGQLSLTADYVWNFDGRSSRRFAR